jgi:hypothetical protein
MEEPGNSVDEATTFTMVSRNTAATASIHTSRSLLITFYSALCISFTSFPQLSFTCALAFQHVGVSVVVPSPTLRHWNKLKHSERGLMNSMRSSTLLFSSTYGRNAEIWPPTNDQPVKLADSFPNGVIPEQVTAALQQIGFKQQSEIDNENGVERQTKPVVKWRKRLPRAMARILRRAASKEEEAFSGDISGMDLTPVAVALVLLLSGYVRPLDVILVSFLTGYFLILGMLARSLRMDNVTPVLPALPPQGHVPTLVSNPLGYSFTYSKQYDLFLKCGVLVGLVAPILTCVRYALQHQRVQAQACARPIFFLCFQALSEAMSRSRRVMTPLPIRILIPVAYNTVRLGYLWNWSFCPAHLGWAGRALAVANFWYWSLNLFGFLLPVAVMRYMRAHFYCVEAEQVTTRAGMEESIGLSA